MPAIKRSKQRDAIIDFLSSRTDHPTADIVYVNIRKQFPNISLGTVYRNLSLLAQLGEIQKISTGTGADRFDWNTTPHYHFICTDCGSVIDLEVDALNIIKDISSISFDGQIEGHVAYFYGKCPECLKKQRQAQ